MSRGLQGSGPCWEWKQFWFHWTTVTEGLVGMNWEFGHLDRTMPLSVAHIFTFWKSTMAIGKSTVNGRFLARKIIELGDFPPSHVWLPEGTHEYFMNIPLVYHHMPWISSRFCEYPIVYRWFPIKASIHRILRSSENLCCTGPRQDRRSSLWWCLWSGARMVEKGRRLRLIWVWPMWNALKLLF